MKVLITGHRGFLGRHFAAAFDGHDVYGVDIADGADARDHFRHDDTHVDLVIHCAAVVGGRQTIEGAPLDLAVDLAIDAEMFGWALRARPDAVVYVSSSAAYPVGLQHQPCRLRETDIDLDDVRSPDLTYGWSKLTGEMLARHAEAEGLRVHVLRPFSGYGRDQHPDYPFRAFIDRAAGRADPFDIWGDGEQVRDFIHVDDLVGAALAIVNEDLRGPVNLGWGRPTSFNELAHMVCDRAGYQPPFRHHLDAPVGVRYRVADNSRMLTVYQPQIPLELGIAMALGQRCAA